MKNANKVNNYANPTNLRLTPLTIHCQYTQYGTQMHAHAQTGISNKNLEKVKQHTDSPVLNHKAE